ncbi:hypothetical protein [Novosphingobium panipatense]|uniref:hypothetical protein n=1 Tax=Novosphingobium panipatense TaxID=428991 RepID=UPI0036122677
MQYEQDSEVVTASGNVVLRRRDDQGRVQSVRADTVRWDRDSGRIVADGNVRMVDDDGNQLYTEQVELTDELKTGMMENLLLVLREGGRLAALKGERIPNGDVILTRAAYTGCDVVDDDGCPKNPSWRVVAKQVIYSDADKRVRFKEPGSSCSDWCSFRCSASRLAPTAMRCPASLCPTSSRARRTGLKSLRRTTGR